jgi:predicted nucleic acid-binding Zn finger protein
MAEIYREVTKWDPDYSVPNHLYLFSSSDSIIAYINSIDNSLHRLKAPLRISKTGRKFVKETNHQLAKIAKEFETQNFNSNTKKYKVISKDKEYIVEEYSGKYSCTCVGYSFRGKCKHIVAVIESLKK